MSTRAIIGMPCVGNSIRYIRVEHDGYPDQTGDALVNCYDTIWKCWGNKGDEIDLDAVLVPNPLGEAQALIKYIVSQAEVMKQEASDVHYSYKNADYQLGIHLQNIQSACKDINSLLEMCKNKK